MQEKNSSANPTLKRILAVIAGLLTAGILVSVLEGGLGILFHSDAKIDCNNKEQVDAFMRTLPSTFFICLVCVYAICGFLGGYIATIIYKINLLAAIIVAFVFCALTLINCVSFYHPLWTVVLAALLSLASPWLGGRFALNKNQDL